MAKRIPNLVPGKQYTFTETLPESPDAAVTVTITNPASTIVTQGPATVNMGLEYQLQWTVPGDAAEGEWQIEWAYTYNTGANTRSIIRGFVITKGVGSESEYQQATVLAESTRDYLELFLDFQAAEVNATLQKIGTLEGLKTSPTAVAGLPQVEEEALDNGGYKYRLWTPATGLQNGEYLLTWSYKATASSPTERVMDVVWSAPPVIWSLVKQLRQYIDKIQKRAGIIQAYNDAELTNNLVKGLQIINRIVPMTQWNFSTVPWQWFELYLIEGAALWSLRTQYLLEGDLQFGFQGQSLSLDYDHLGFLSEEINRLEDDLNNPEKLKATKKSYMERTGVVATVGVRTRRPEIQQWQ